MVRFDRDTDNITDMTPLLSSRGWDWNGPSFIFKFFMYVNHSGSPWLPAVIWTEPMGGTSERLNICSLWLMCYLVLTVHGHSWQQKTNKPTNKPKKYQNTGLGFKNEQKQELHLFQHWLFASFNTWTKVHKLAWWINTKTVCNLHPQDSGQKSFTSVIGSYQPGFCNLENKGKYPKNQMLADVAKTAIFICLEDVAIKEKMCCALSSAYIECWFCISWLQFTLMQPSAQSVICKYQYVLPFHGDKHYRRGTSEANVNHSNLAAVHVGS